MPPKALGPLLHRAKDLRIAVHAGFCEKAEGKYFNTALLTDTAGKFCGTFRKIHLPGTREPDGFAQVYEPYYFAHGDTGYKIFNACGAKIGIAICQDRRYPESYRALALQGAEIILIGYNTPISALALDLNELCMLAADGLAVFAAVRLHRFVPMGWVRRVAAGLFFFFGLGALLGAAGLI